ncbi:probable endonuclease/exonuclease/phosphatase family protein [Rhynchosporium agropyri]|uniref:Probable endonuclease/exonuclease/phosphatase family protein n=1 Tax=Rhynchosporium agropyri TaxID=914238 RepID=A0A1E1K9K8_9HELO|nr:probable endonuclease/exonuclease/phosphatase family protein [Rhynchosporium agropyri]
MARLTFGLAAAAASLVSTISAAATSGGFNVITMNVAGLPAVLNGNEIPGDKTTNSKLIGSLFAKYGYDVIHAQEDFNFHAAVYETDNHPFRTPTSGGVPFGSGLNTLSNFDWINFIRKKWNTCSNASGADCLTPKGFTMMRVRIEDGVYIDMYNLHSDAGTEPADLVARAANLKELSDYIKLWSTGNAVVVFGDTNSRYSRAPNDIPNIFADQNGMEDVFVEIPRKGVTPTVETLCNNPSLINTCETVDKIFYRGSRQLTLQATYFNYESSKFLQPDGSILSDHNPVSANFTWKVSPSFRQSNYYGGPHGNWFNDLDALPAKPKTSVITFRGSNRVDSVGLTLTNGQTLVHGGSGGSAVTLYLASNEFWVSAKLCQAQQNGSTRIFYILATTSTGRTVTTGKTTADCVTYSAPAGWQIVGYNGQDGDEVDQLAFIYAPQ